MLHHAPVEPAAWNPVATCHRRRGAGRVAAAGRWAPRVASAALRSRSSRSPELSGGDGGASDAGPLESLQQPPARTRRRVTAASEPKVKTRRPAAKKSAAPAVALEPPLLLPTDEPSLILLPEPTGLLGLAPPSAAFDDDGEPEAPDAGDQPDADDLDYGPPNEAPDGAAPPLGVRGRGTASELVGRDWKAVVDWQLMGHEHVSMPDADFAALCKRIKGLKAEWRPMVSYLHSLGLGQRELSRLVAKEPQIFVGNVGRARSRVAFLQSSFAMTQAELVRILEVAPRVLFLRVERTLAKRLAFLESLAIPREKLGHVVSRMPTLLYTTVDTLEPRVKYLDFVLKMTPQEVGRMVLRHPNVLTCNEGMLESRLLFLFTLGLTDDQVKRMVMSHPQLLQYTPTSMTPRVTWLAEEVGMSPEEIVHTVSKLGQLFSLSVDNSLRPKYDYLLDKLGGDKATLLACPTFLSLSLAARIMPRHHFMLERRGCVSRESHSSASGMLEAISPFSIWDFASADPAFARATEVPLEDWLAFRDAFVLRNEATAAAAAEAMELRAADAVPEALAAR